jgi:hypothetical protein
MPKIESAKIAILATDGYERSELREPLDFLKSKGAKVDVVSLKSGEIKSWDEDNWGDSVTVDKTLDEVSVRDYDALVLPGGQINPDLLRVEEKAVSFVREFAESGKTLAAICHGPCRSKLERSGSGDRRGRDHLAQPEGPAGVQRQDRRGDRRRPSRASDRCRVSLRHTED